MWRIRHCRATAAAPEEYTLAQDFFLRDAANCSSRDGGFTPLGRETAPSQRPSSFLSSRGSPITRLMSGRRCRKQWPESVMALAWSLETRRGHRRSNNSHTLTASAAAAAPGFEPWGVIRVVLLYERKKEYCRNDVVGTLDDVVAITSAHVHTVIQVGAQPRLYYCCCACPFRERGGFPILQPLLHVCRFRLNRNARDERHPRHGQRHR